MVLNNILHAITRGGGERTILTKTQIWQKAIALCAPEAPNKF